MRSPRLIIFDLNFVIEDPRPFAEVSKDVVGNVVRELREHLELDSECNDVKMLYRRTVPMYHHYTFWRQVLSDLMQTTPHKIPFDEVEYAYKLFVEAYLPYAAIYNDFNETMLRLRAKGTKVALVANSNAFRANSFLAKFNLNKAFDAIRISGETPFAKPDPIIFESVISDLNIKPWDVLMVGDRPDNDVLGGNQAGLWTALLTRKSFIRFAPPHRSTTADFHVSTLIDILHIDLPNQSESVIDTVVILAGGSGKRMGDSGQQPPKILRDLGNGWNSLEWQLRIWEDFEIQNIIVLLNTDNQLIQQYLAVRPKRSKIKCILSGARNTARSLLAAKNECGERFIYVHSDMLYDSRLAAQIIKYSLVYPDDTVLSICDGRIAPTHTGIVLADRWRPIAKRFVFPEEKEDMSYSLPVSLGLGVLNKNIFPHLEKCDDEAMVEHGISALLKNGDGFVRLCEYNGELCHIVYREDLEAARAFVSDRKHISPEVFDNVQ